MYQKLAGMTGTALTEAEEFNKIYKLEVAPVSPNLEYQSLGKDAALIEIKTKDEDGYAYSYFANAGPRTTLLSSQGLSRCDLPHSGSQAAFDRRPRSFAIMHLGRPLLVGTTSVESSDQLSSRLRAEPVRRLLQLALVRDALPACE